MGKKAEAVLEDSISKLDQKIAEPVFDPVREMSEFTNVIGLVKTRLHEVVEQKIDDTATNLANDMVGKMTKKLKD